MLNTALKFIFVVLLFITVVLLSRNAHSDELTTLQWLTQLKTVKQELLDEKVSHRETLGKFNELQLKYNLLADNFRVYEGYANGLEQTILDLQYPYRNYDIFMNFGVYMGTSAVISYNAGIFLYKGLSLNCMITGAYDVVYFKTPFAFAGIGFQYNLYWRWK